MNRTISTIFALIISLVGVYVLIDINWKILFGVFLLIWSNNIVMNSRIEIQIDHLEKLMNMYLKDILGNRR